MDSNQNGSLSAQNSFGGADLSTMASYFPEIHDTEAVHSLQFHP